MQKLNQQLQSGNLHTYRRKLYLSLNWIRVTLNASIFFKIIIIVIFINHSQEMGYLMASPFANNNIFASYPLTNEEYTNG